MNSLECEIPDIPKLLSEKKLTQKEAIYLIAEKMQRDPRYFCIDHYKDELRSDIILKFIEKGHIVLQNFSSEYGSFYTWLKSFIYYQVMTAKREQFHDNIAIQTYKPCSTIDAEEVRENYHKDEFSYKIAHFSLCEIPQNQKAPYLRNTLSVADVSDGKVRIETKSLNRFKKFYSKERKTVLILALKACFFINDENILKIANFCKVPVSEFCDAIDNLRGTLEEKNEKFRLLENKRNDSYFKHQKYRKIIENNKYSSENKKMTHLYKFHTNNWLNRNKQVGERIKNICPTNKNIANILGICERQVGYYLNNAESFLKKYSDDSAKPKLQ